MSPADRQRRKFLLQAAFVVVLAWLLREQFILFTQVDNPIRGDVRQYVYYAWNLIHQGKFSMTPPGSAIVTADNFRSPGYPLFLAAAMRTGGEGGGWYAIVLQAQAMLGAATVALAIALGQRWLARGAALSAGLLLAVWPHNIAATGAVLSEVLFGFLLVLSLWLAAQAITRPGPRWAIASGATLGLAYLVNPVVLLFPLVAALLFLRTGLRRQAAWLVFLPMLMAGAWGLRNAGLPPTPGQPSRAILNFVEGSWPQYHAAFNFKDIDPVAVAISAQIEAEEKQFARSPRLGFARIIERMQEAPAYYATWYILRKPWLLWDWNIRIGWGDVYYQQVQHSPLDGNPPLRVMKTGLRLLNPIIFLLALAGTAATLARLARRPAGTDSSQLPVALLALFCVYVTLVHTVFQAEPRYSIPYRPMELLLAVTAIAGIAGWARVKLSFGNNAREKPLLP